MNLSRFIANNANLLNGVLFLAASFCLSAYADPASAADKIGEVIFARGAVSAQTSGAQLRLLGKKAAIYRGDTITTGPKSFAVITLHDGTRLSIRPDSVLAINDYADTVGKESAVMRLFRGGLRSISGFISKRNPNAFQVHTAVATIGIRGTEFDVRLCQANCSDKVKGLAGKKTVSPSSVVGRVAFLKGKASASKAGKASRILTRGAPLYEGDEIITGKSAYAILVFRDQGRVTLKPESQFKIEQYSFNKDDPTNDSSFFRLVKGGIRALTGLMSKRNPDSFKVYTAVATIGIRGTGFDLLWLGPCTSSPDCGLVAAVWKGAITSENDSGTGDIGLDQIARIGAINLRPEFIDKAPVFTVPRPDTVDVDFENLFGTQSLSGTEDGVYVACYEGHCAMFQEDREIDLGAGEAGFASIDGKQLVRLEQIDNFQKNDPYLNTINDVFSSLYEILDDSVVTENEFQCVVQ